MCDKCKIKKFICECGKEFNKASSLGSHKVHCKIHLASKIQKDNLEKEKRRLPNGMFKCDNPECQNEHDGSYGSGRFCSKHCRLSFIAKEAYKTKVQNGTFKSGFSEFNLKRRAPYGTWKCEQCNLIFKTRAQLEEHCLKANHTHQIIEISKFMFRCPFCDYTGNKNQVAAHLVSCKNHPNKENHDLAHKKAGKTLSENIKSGKIKAAWKGRRHTEESKRKLSLKGGKRKHSGRGKQGKYHGIWCDSSWELAWIIYQEEHNVQFTRYNGYFEYMFDGKTHKYYPDFELADGTIVEIKGYKSEQWKAKLDQFPSSKKLVIIGKNEIQPFLDYVIQKYGKNFIKLYEKKERKDNMPRYAKANQTIDDLKKKILSLSEEAKVNISYAVYEILNSGRYRMQKIEDDLSKIEVDGENAELIGEFNMPGTEDLEQFEMLNNVPIAWCAMGGDWEMPIVVVLYIGDKGELRAYIPSDGNAFNKKAKAAYGNDDEEDFDEDKDYVFDANKLREDVKNRIQVK